MAFLTLSDFHAARKHIDSHVHRTPVIGSETLSRMTGFDVVLKAELFQKAGSYKVRGPLNVLANMSEEAKSRGLVTSSAGNHAQGVARAARIHNVPAVVVMSKAAKPAKIDATRGYGAEVVIHGEVWDDAYAHSLEIMKERGLTYIHPFDDPQLVVGQGLVGLELIEDVPDLDVVVVPIGGGGLIAGCAQAIKAVKPDVRIIGVEAAQSPAMRRSLDAGKVTPLNSFGPMIDGLVVKRVGDYTFDVVRNFVDDVVLVDEQRIFETVVLLMERLKLVPEAAAASPVAAILDGLIEAPKGAKVACVLSGGNLDLSALRGMAWN